MEVVVKIFLQKKTTDEQLVDYTEPYYILLLNEFGF